MRLTPTAAVLALLLVPGCAQQPVPTDGGDRLAAVAPAVPSDIALPDNLSVTEPEASLDPRLAAWVGTWSGKWEGKLNHVLVVEEVTVGGEATAVYAVGRYGPWRVEPIWYRKPGTIADGTLTLTGFERGHKATYRLEGDTVSAVFHADSGPIAATMRRVPTGG